jgi:two-component system chemotaxis response regulator CheB
MIKTLIVDDSPLVRAIIRDFLESDGDFEIIGEAENGLDGVTQAVRYAPDLITMDIEMPVMNGLEAIGEIKKSLSTTIVVISTHDTAKMAYDATVKGALEFFAKDLFTSKMSGQMRDRILNTLKQITGIKKRLPASQKTVQQAKVNLRKIKCVVIASSTGGPNALCQLLSAINKDFAVPIMIVQHNMSGFDLGLVQWLDACTQLDVRLAEAGTIPAKGNVYIAPTDKHMIISSKGISFDNREPINNQKPSADFFFKSAAEFYGDSVVSVVLTGMGSDGAEGTRHIKQAGGITIAQDEATSMIYGMPLAAVETGCVDMVLPLGTIAEQLKFLIKEE